MRKGVRSCTHYPISNFVAYDHLSSSVQAFVVNISGVDIPKNIQEAWDIVAKPEGKTLKGCKWIFTVKYKADKSIERYKARLAAKGYSQAYSIDYQ